MKSFTKKIENDKIIFKNLLDNTTISITHHNEDYIYDTIIIDERYSLDFLDFIIRKLKETKDIRVLYSLYDSKDLLDLLEKHNLKVSNYQYTIKSTKKKKYEDIDISSVLSDDSKVYYLDKINEAAKINHEYFNPASKFREYSNVWFDNSEYVYRIYQKDNKILGIVEYTIFDNTEKNNSKYEIFSTSNKLCIRCLFGEELKIVESIIKDLLNTYQKDIVVNFTYTDEILKNAITNLDGKFDFCQYILIGNN